MERRLASAKISVDRVFSAVGGGGAQTHICVDSWILVAMVATVASRKVLSLSIALQV